jgi:GH24 family phage-related lysozyme (muramidase)
MSRKSQPKNTATKESYPLLTEKGIELIKRHTTPRTFIGMDRYAAYKAYGENFWRIGYGSKKLGKRTVGFKDKINKAQIEEQLVEDLKAFSKEMQSYVFVKLNNNKKAALLSFAHSVGIVSFKNCRLLELINKGASRKEIIREWSPFINHIWRSGGEPMVNRRRAELNTYLEPDTTVSTYFNHDCESKYCLLNLCETWNGSPYQIKAIEYLERKIALFDTNGEVMRRFFRYWSMPPGGQQSPQQQ